LEITFPKEGIMVLGDMFERFILDAPMPVLFRLLMERALDPEELDRMFESTATRQYTRELLFSSVVDLIAVVVCRIKPSVRRAYLDSSGIAATLTAVYEKLKGTESAVCRSLVRTTGKRLAEVVKQLEPDRPAPLPGYHVKIFDGNHLAGTQHRIPVTRTVDEAVLPGQTLVVYDLDLGLVIDAVPCEDAHAQERTMLNEMLADCVPDDLWVGDRNFSVAWWFLEVSRRKAYFLVRQHSTAVHIEPVDGFVVIGRSATGEVQEQKVLVVERDGHGRPRLDERGNRRQMEVRRLRVVLDEPTQDGDTEVMLLTNIPAGDADALMLSGLYLKRWTIENGFQTMTEVLRCEINTLAYPKAALLGFCVALVGLNILATVRSALRSQHGAETVDKTVSSYHVMCEVRETHRGMIIALPPESWGQFRSLSLAEFVELLREVASQANLRKYPLSHRKPKPSGKRSRSRRTKKGRNEATARLLDQRVVKR
jgi:Transposase DDE domain